jgi:hypothetical protein
MRILIVLFLSSFCLIAAPIKVAILGDSIAFGSGAKPRETKR